MVISEGPHDAQERTVARLGIAPGIDLLVTSAGEQALEGATGCSRGRSRVRTASRLELLYAGDSIERDIAPASALGIATVYVGEEEPPDGLAAIRVDLAGLGRLLDKVDRS